MLSRKKSDLSCVWRKYFFEANAAYMFICRPLALSEEARDVFLAFIEHGGNSVRKPAAKRQLFGINKVWCDTDVV